MGKRKLLVMLLLVSCMILPGCYLFDTKANVTTGDEITNLEAGMVRATAMINTVAPLANMFVPGVGTIAGGVGMLLALIGGLTTSIVVAKKRGGALAAVIKGVELAGSAETKTQIKEIAGATGIEPYLSKVVKKIYPT